MPDTSTRQRRPRTELATDVGARIKLKREMLGLSTGDLGRSIGVTANAVTQYETGRAVPKQERLDALVKALGTSTEWLLTGHEPERLAYAQNRLELDLLALIREIPEEQRPVVLAAVKGVAEAARRKRGQ